MRWSSRCCTDLSARTAWFRGTSRPSACPTSGRASCPRPSAWTRGSPSRSSMIATSRWRPGASCNAEAWSPDVLTEAVYALGLPLFIKPANLGSSIGVAKATEITSVGDAVAAAFEFDDHVILEEFVPGRELELAITGNEEVRVSQAGEITREFEISTTTRTNISSARRRRSHPPTSTSTSWPTPSGWPRRPIGRCAWRDWPSRPLPPRRRRDRGQRSQHHAGIHTHLNVPHAVGGRGSRFRRGDRGPGGSGPGPSRTAPGAAHPPHRLSRQVVDPGAGVPTRTRLPPMRRPPASQRSDGQDGSGRVVAQDGESNPLSAGATALSSHGRPASSQRIST